MRRLILILASLLLLTTVLSAQDEYAALDDKLREYTDAIDGESFETRYREVDFLIGSCADSPTRSHVALWLYERYRTSKLMGSENVAVHIFDRWLATGEAGMDDTELMAARMYADFNRRSLIGAQAPRLTLQDTADSDVTFPLEGHYSVLYFYDTDCSRCAVESIMLRNVMDNGGWPVRLYAVYVGADSSKWKDYAAGHLNFASPAIHLWDRDRNLDFQMAYGVLKTPQMILVNPDGKVIGRELTSTALEQMLDGIFSYPELEYGSEKGMEFYTSVFGEYVKDHGRVTAEDVDEIAGHIAARTIERADTTLFRQMAGDLLYWLATNSGEGIREGEERFIDSYILPLGKVWRSPSDSLTVVSLAMLRKELLSKAPVGEKVPAAKVDGVMLRRRNLIKGKEASQRSWNLRRIGRAYVLFHIDGCSRCAAQIDSARAAVIADRRTKVLLAEPSDGLSELFDLSNFPYTVELDGRGVVRRRYVIF